MFGTYSLRGSLRRRLGLLRTVPWMTDGAVAFLAAYLKGLADHAVVVEFGAGASTVWFGARAKLVVCVEDNQSWVSKVQEVVRQRRLEVDLRQRPRPYVDAVSDLADETADILSIDGRDRVECVRANRRLVKPGGVLVVDNTERVTGYDGLYGALPGLVAGWNAIHFEQVGRDQTGWRAPHRWVTSIWQKPPAQSPLTTAGRLL